ncbi:carbohydrate ABC transporter permease [Sinomonas albida]|uniref:carbohydrate ABC transporter permease n=1 Tax=Sinomonas albida TaxID=369942 RepID=UPI0010A7EFCD|nr:sugar ABC transporter permease [Sinomonas albida]
MATTLSASPSRQKPISDPVRRRSAQGRRRNVGWLFVAPFGIVFVLFLVAPLLYALYLSLFNKGLATGTTFVGISNYVKAFTDPNFLNGVAFVLLFALVLIPVQMAVSLAAALVLDAFSSLFVRFSRLMIFLPYAIPAVIGALMWGFLYSPSFGPLQQIFGANAPALLSPSNIFGALVNVVTWQWAGYYMIIIYAALQGIDKSLYEAARIDGANGWQIAWRLKVPMVASSLVLIVVFALIGTLQFFTEPEILAPISNGSIQPNTTPNIYAYSQAFSYANFNYASALSFALGIVVLIAIYIFMFATRKRGSILS